MDWLTHMEGQMEVTLRALTGRRGRSVTGATCPMSRGLSRQVARVSAARS